MAVRILDRHLEGTQVDLTDGLFVGPSSHHGSTVAFLIVQGEVLHVSVDAVFLSALDGVGSHDAGQDAVLRVILEVTASECSAVDVHSGAVPAGGVHLIGHLADAVAEGVSQLLAPSHADEGSSRETDRTDAGEVVIDGSRAVAVIGTDLLDAGNGSGLVAAKADELLHILNGHLIQQVIPLGVVVIHAAQVNQLQAVLCAGGDVLSICVVVSLIARLGVAVGVVEHSLVRIGHLIVCGSSGSLGIVCEAVGTGQIGDLAFCEIVGIVVGADDIVASFQHIAAVGLVIIGSQILHRDGELHGLRLAGSQLIGLGEVQQICRGLLDAAIGVRRIAVDLHNILTGSRTGVGNGDGEVQVGAVGGDAAHFLGEGSVAQAIAEGEHDFIVVVDQAFVRSSLIELVADVDAFHVVDEGRSGAFRVKEACIRVQILGVGVLEVAKVVPPRSSGQIRNIGICGTARGVDLAGNNLAEALKAGLTGAGAEQNALDLRIILQEVHLESVCAVVDQNDVVEVGSDQIEQILFAVGQLQEVVALIPVVALVQGIVVSTIVVSGAALRAVSLCHAADPAAVRDGSHIGGQVSALAADAGDDDHGGVRECLGVLHHLIGVQIDIGFGQGPVLLHHANAGAVRLVIGVELAQFLVGLDAGIVQTGQQIGDRVSGVQRT